MDSAFSEVVVKEDGKVDFASWEKECRSQNRTAGGVHTGLAHWETAVPPVAVRSLGSLDSVMARWVRESWPCRHREGVSQE